VVVTTPLTFAAGPPGPLEPLSGHSLPFFISTPTHFYPSSPPGQSAGFSRIAPTPPILALSVSRGPGASPSLYLKSPLWAPGAQGSSQHSHFSSAAPALRRPAPSLLPCTPASFPMSVPSTCHSPAPAGAEGAKIRAAYLCGALPVR
jgi:hypothetical protein